MTRSAESRCTIQADQDAVIRAGSRGALVVDGGPGTGKTVVALHRSAYLLYSDCSSATRRVRTRYDRLLAQGRASQAAALQVGRQVEHADIDALRVGLDGLTAPDVRQVYTHLLAASQHHLMAFTRWSTR